MNEGFIADCARNLSFVKFDVRLRRRFYVVMNEFRVFSEYCERFAGNCKSLGDDFSVG